MTPTRFASGALITRNNFDALDGGFPRPRPVGMSGRGNETSLHLVCGKLTTQCSVFGATA
jgi:hypothetical protein